MDSEPESAADFDEPWRFRLISDLLEQQKVLDDIWGGIDEMTLLNYHEGMLNDERRAEVERAMVDHPAIEESLAIFREIDAGRDGPQLELPTLATKSPTRDSDVPKYLSAATDPFSSTRSRYFSTPIEWLTAATVLLVAVGLSIPAIQSARAASRRAQCANNLKQIGLAAHNYLDAYRVLPLGGYFNDRVPKPAWMHGSLIGLTQFMETGVVFNSFNFSLPYDQYPQNITAVGARLTVFACPSDPTVLEGKPFSPDAPMQDVRATSGGITAGLTSYRANCGPWESPPRVSDPRMVPNWADLRKQALGVIYLESSVSMEEVSDGTSNTLLFGEADYGQLSQVDKDKSHLWIAGNYGDTMQSAMYPPNSNRAGAASSNHPGGANFLFCDGSIRFIKNSIQSWQIDPTTALPYSLNVDQNGIFRNTGPFGLFQALSTRNGGEAIGKDSY